MPETGEEQDKGPAPVVADLYILQAKLGHDLVPGLPDEVIVSILMIHLHESNDC